MGIKLTSRCIDIIVFRNCSKASFTNQTLLSNLILVIADFNNFSLWNVVLKEFFYSMASEAITFYNMPYCFASCIIDTYGFCCLSFEVMDSLNILIP